MDEDGHETFVAVKKLKRQDISPEVCCKKPPPFTMAASVQHQYQRLFVSQLSARQTRALCADSTTCTKQCSMWKGLTAERTVYASPERWYLRSIVRCLGAGACWSDSAASGWHSCLPAAHVARACTDGEDGRGHAIPHAREGVQDCVRAVHGQRRPPQINGQATYNTNNTYNTQSSYASQDEQDEVEMLFSKMSPVRTPLLKPPLDTTAHGALQVNLVAVMHACCDGVTCLQQDIN